MNIFNYNFIVNVSCFERHPVQGLKYFFDTMKNFIHKISSSVIMTTVNDIVHLTRIQNWSNEIFKTLFNTNLDFHLFLSGVISRCLYRCKFHVISEIEYVSVLSRCTMTLDVSVRECIFPFVLFYVKSLPPSAGFIHLEHFPKWTTVETVQQFGS